MFFWGVIVARYMHAQIGESLRCDFHGDDSKIDYWLQVTVRMSKQLQDTIAITMLNVTQFSLKRMVVQWEMLICLFSPISVLCFLECSMPTPGTAASFHAPFWFAVNHYKWFNSMIKISIFDEFWISSLKLTFSNLKMDSWNTVVSFLGFGLCSGAKMLVSGSVFLRDCLFDYLTSRAPLRDHELLLAR